MWESVSSKMHQLWGSSFFENFQNWMQIYHKKKESKNIFRFLDNWIWKCPYKMSLFKRENFLSAVNRLRNKKQSYDFGYHLERIFQPKLPAQGWINTVKVLSFCFEQCFSPFNLLPVVGSSETGLFRYLSNHVFRSP